MNPYSENENICIFLMSTKKITSKTKSSLFTAVIVTLILAFHTSVEAAAGAVTKDKIHAYEGVLTGSAAYTSNSGGHTAKPGDYALDLPTAGGTVVVKDASFLNTAAVHDEMTFAFWGKKYDIASSSAFWANSLQSNNGQRGW